MANGALQAADHADHRQGGAVARAGETDRRWYRWPAATIASLAVTMAVTGCTTTGVAPPGGPIGLPAVSGAAARPSQASVTAAVVGSRFVTPVTVGGLTVVPASPGTGAMPLGLDLADATADVGYAGGLGGLGDHPIVGFGLVTVRGVASPAGSPTGRATPAWVGIALGVNEVAVNCPAEPVGGVPSAGPPVPEDRVVVLYGEEGHGADLYDTGGTRPCTGTRAPPTLAAADATVPVSWQQQGPAGLATTVQYQAPECATLASTSAGGNVRTGVYTVEVTVTFPFDRTGCAALGTFTTSVRVYPASVGPGAPAPPAVVHLVPSAAPGAVPPSLVGPMPQAGR